MMNANLQIYCPDMPVNAFFREFILVASSPSLGRLVPQVRLYVASSRELIKCVIKYKILRPMHCLLQIQQHYHNDG